jgi:hypothetical protein
MGAKLGGGAQIEVEEIFGPKRDEMTRGWRKLHNEELRALYSSPSISRTIKSRRMRPTEHVAQMENKLNTLRLLVRKSERKRPLGEPKHRMDRWILEI